MRVSAVQRKEVFLVSGRENLLASVILPRANLGLVTNKIWGSGPHVLVENFIDKQEKV